MYTQYGSVQINTPSVHSCILVHVLYSAPPEQTVDVDDVAPPPIKLSDAKCHALLLSYILLDGTLHYGINEIISF